MTLSYESTFQPPSELDHQFEIAWAQSLRRRFLWYCGVTVGISVPGLMLFAVLMFLPSGMFQTRGMFFSLGVGSVSLVLYIAAWLYAYRLPPKRSVILALAFGLYVTANTLSLFSSRIQTGMGPIIQPAPATSQPKTFPSDGSISGDLQAGFQKGLQSSAKPAPKGTLPTPAMVFAWTAPAGLFVNHLFVCLFMPWSFKQSVRPALVILGVATSIFLFDLLMGKIGWMSIVSPLLVLVAFVPGSVWCWWRFSRFRRRFRLYYESSAYRKLQVELLNAQRIHESQFPAMRTTGEVQMYYAYEPMRQIGGDLLFAYPPANVPTNQLTAVIFDVTGHGIAAALIVNRLVGELERSFGENPEASPNEILEALNKHVYYTLAKHSMFVTAMVVKIDAANNTLTYASGGHPTAFVHRNNNAIEQLESTTYMLGVIDPKTFTGEQISMPLSKGESVVLYTDGAVEARSPETNQALGIAGLQATLESFTQTPCPGWPEALLRQVAAHRQTPAEDDTLVVTLCRV